MGKECVYCGDTSVKLRGESEQSWLVVGSATVDCVEQEDRTDYKAGGVVVYGGLTLLQHGLSVAVCTQMAQRDRDVVALLKSAGAEVYVGESLETTHFVNRVSGDQRQQLMPLAADPIGRDALVAALGARQNVLLGPLHPLDIAVEVFDWLAELEDRMVYADVQGLVRSVRAGRVVPRVDSAADALLRAAQSIKVAQEEWSLLLAWTKCDWVEMMERYRLCEVIVTDGSRGGYICTADGGRHAFAAAEVGQIYDPTGAGDVFFASYLSQRIGRGRSIEASARMAAQMAGRQVAGELFAAETLGLQRP